MRVVEHRFPRFEAEKSTSEMRRWLDDNEIVPSHFTATEENGELVVRTGFLRTWRRRRSRSDSPALSSRRMSRAALDRVTTDGSPSRVRLGGAVNQRRERSSRGDVVGHFLKQCLGTLRPCRRRGGPPRCREQCRELP